jgi:hypothetical protein
LPSGTALSYDSRGNLTSSSSTAYGYTVENRLKSVSGAMTAGYDSLGRLAEYNTLISTRFLYDGDRVTAELDNQGAVNQVKRRYIWGAGADELVAWYEGTGSATRRFVVQDERASIVAVSDSAGALVGILAKLLRLTYSFGTVILAKTLDFLGFSVALSIPARLHQSLDKEIVRGTIYPTAPERWRG